MDIVSVLFYVFAAILLFSGFRVITAKNPVHAALFLVLAFVTSACLWMMLNVEFLALTLILVYVGAVMVLFLFVVMMLDVDLESLRKGFWKNMPLALVLGVVVLLEMLLVIVKNPVVTSVANVDPESKISNANKLGWVLYTQYSYPVELASMILLLGLVVAVALTLRKTDKQAKYQNIAAQVAVDSKTRFTMVKMAAEVEEISSEENKQETAGDKQ
ncbi:NADH-quinone oxidoreductase subunit J [Aquella oligotrophica]|uniref:NADH-quinone oxidoreductase subunit J n=1 Tax=Aquella oligotrophica TaxID=2067065 RepID=A0A2I7N4K2_9NEIS|nr:NADH-quinone oxidoreductase subunit J [Aquella oligotrophica]AUR51390.1 NADH-quinone oxidoreductase subunit J [Aquella oligotrophica]